jgi:hypothetical protein
MDTVDIDYDATGVYWGFGLPIFSVESDMFTEPGVPDAPWDCIIDYHFRIDDLASAVAFVQARYPLATVVVF